MPNATGLGTMSMASRHHSWLIVSWPGQMLVQMQHTFLALHEAAFFLVQKLVEIRKQYWVLKVFTNKYLANAGHTQRPTMTGTPINPPACPNCSSSTPAYLQHHIWPCPKFTRNRTLNNPANVPSCHFGHHSVDRHPVDELQPPPYAISHCELLFSQKSHKSSTEVSILSRHFTTSWHNQFRPHEENTGSPT